MSQFGDAIVPFFLLGIRSRSGRLVAGPLRKEQRKEILVIWKEWMTVAADQWNSLVNSRSPRSGGCWLQSLRNPVAAVFPADCSGSRPRALHDARRRNGRTGAASSGLSAIYDELNSLAETQRLLAILAATAVREGDVQESPWVNLAEQARLLASRAEQASETLAGVLRSRMDRDGSE